MVISIRRSAVRPLSFFDQVFAQLNTLRVWAGRQASICNRSSLASDLPDSDARRAVGRKSTIKLTSLNHPRSSLVGSVVEVSLVLQHGVAQLSPMLQRHD